MDASPTPSPQQQNPDGPARQPSSAAKTTKHKARTSATKPRNPRVAPNASRSSLFWIHTDPQSVPNGTSAEDLKRIRSHVMSEHNRKKRLENTKQYKSRACKQSAYRLESTSSTSSDAAVELWGETINGQTGFGSNDFTYEAILQDDTTVHTLPVPSQAIAVTPWMGGPESIDPFGMSHTPLTDRMMRHLRHFLVDLSRDGVPFQNRRLDKIEKHWGALVQQDPACLHACICVASSDIALKTGEFPLVDPTQPSSALLLDTFHHRGETIRLVNEGLSDPVKAASDGLIAAVSMLLTIEIATGTPAYLKMHLAGLRQMVRLRNTFTDVPYPIRYQISWTDIRVACMAHTKPIFPPVRNPRPSSIPIGSPTEYLAPLASRLFVLSQLTGALSPVMSETIFDLVQLTWYAECIKTSGHHVFDEQTEDYFNGEVLYVEYTLHNDRYMQNGEVKGDASIEGCVRLACLLFHNTTIWEFYPANAGIFPKPLVALRMALETAIPSGYFHLCPDVLIWILAMGACSCNSLMAHERSYFVMELAHVIRAHGIHSWQELRVLLMDFFYLDRTHLVPLRGLWDEIRTMPIQ